MTVSNIDASGTSFQASSTQRNAFRQQFKQLEQDIQSGNLQAAQQDYTALSKLQSSQQGSSSQGGGSNSPFGQLLSQIGSSLQSGNIQGAQQALSSFKQQEQTSQAAVGPQTQGKGHHHHHHSQAADSTDSSTDTVGSVSTTA